MAHTHSALLLFLACYSTVITTLLNIAELTQRVNHNMKLSLVSLVGCLVCGALARTPAYQKLPPLRDQAELQNQWVAERKAAIPALLEKHHMDAWLV